MLAKARIRALLAQRVREAEERRKERLQFERFRLANTKGACLWTLSKMASGPVYAYTGKDGSILHVRERAKPLGDLT